jgi:hypothetical protein
MLVLVVGGHPPNSRFTTRGCNEVGKVYSYTIDSNLCPSGDHERYYVAFKCNHGKEYAFFCEDQVELIPARSP